MVVNLKRKSNPYSPPNEIGGTSTPPRLFGRIPRILVLGLTLLNSLAFFIGLTGFVSIIPLLDSLKFESEIIGNYVLFFLFLLMPFVSIMSIIGSFKSASMNTRKRFLLAPGIYLTFCLSLLWLLIIFDEASH